MADYAGADPANLNYDNLTEDGVQLRVVEDTVNNSEAGHVNERISFLALGGGSELEAMSQ